MPKKKFEVEQEKPPANRFVVKLRSGELLHVQGSQANSDSDLSIEDEFGEPILVVNNDCWEYYRVNAPQ